MMEWSQLPVYTTGIGRIASTGLLIFMAGAHGHRVVTPRTSILSHRFAGGAIGNHSELVATRKEQDLVHCRIVNHYLQHTAIAGEEELSRTLLRDVDTWLTTEEAVRLGNADVVQADRKRPWPAVKIDQGRREQAEEPDLLALTVCLHPRVVNIILGDNTSYAQLSSCLDVDRPAARLADVVLPAEVREQVVGAVRAWHQARAGGDARAALSLLLYGPPGTGKTLLAEALAHEFAMPLVRMKNPGRMMGRHLYRPGLFFDAEDVVRFVLRESAAMGAIAFFDECDDIFHNDSFESRCLLLELERQGGLVILATNSPMRLDRALDRRASLRVPFKAPVFELRREIWRVHLERSGPLATDVDPAALATRFFFAGGYIANAVTMARLHGGAGVPLTQNDLLRAADQQRVHFSVDLAGLVQPGEPEFPEFSERTRAQLEGLERVGRDALQRGENLRIRLCGPAEPLLRQTAGALARRLGLGVVFTGMAGLESRGVSVRRQGGGDEDESARDGLASLLRVLPEDCAVALVDHEGDPKLRALFGRMLRAPGIFFHLDASGARPLAPRSHCHFSVTLEPPGPARRAELWRAVLAGEGVSLDPALFEAARQAGATGRHPPLFGGGS